MRLPLSAAASLCLLLALRAAPAQDLTTTCHASSSYDLTLRPGSLLFDRAQPAPYRVELGDGALRADGRTVPLTAEQQDRLAVFERELRALAPRVRAVAQAGVDLAARALHEEAAGMQLDAASLAELDRRVAARADELKRRIAASNSTHDWQGEAAQAYADQLAGDILPLLAGALGQQALEAAMGGDLQQAAQLRDRAADLATSLRPRLERRMQALRPQVQALCPAVRRLAGLQEGLRGGDGRPLDLLETTP
ncbi:DUF2884 family protein [Fulvimonas soli]|uniref:DUF2884 family protein n=1 Tax=Fulvimonas soli TaxID=155197 RepID=A0A316I611_9GAMM|nr:DUF2884 family protein [Fulvimonas soli]PWK85907.1 hypothetical protein C7456_108203 [Fulvimonas soli]TNY25959.1 hypothetical protein BV497_11210 [Fulvimonas soli]